MSVIVPNGVAYAYSPVRQTWCLECGRDRSEHAMKRSDGLCGTCNMRLWKHENPEKARLQGNVMAGRRKKRMRDIPGSHTPAEKKALWDACDNECVIGTVFGLECGGPIETGHIIPVSRKELNPTNSIENLMPQCYKHNRNGEGQWDRTLDEWLGEGAEERVRGYLAAMGAASEHYEKEEIGT